MFEGKMFLENYKKMYFINSMQSKPLVLFGASASGEKTYKLLSQKGVKIDYFCDNNKEKCGKTINNIEIISLNQLLTMDRDINILVTSSFYKEIMAQLKSYGFKNVISFENNTFELFVFLHHFDHYLYDTIFQNQFEIEMIYEILADFSSKQVLLNILRQRLTFDFSYTFSVGEDNRFSRKRQYFDNDLINLTSNETFLDIGACVGEVTKEFIERVNNQFRKIYVFEPQKDNYLKLSQELGNLDNDDKVIIENVGVYSENGRVNFIENGKGSKISNEGTDTIKVIKLDDFLIDEPVTFIKMDIEGSEIEALKGAKNIITKYKPKLAICVYHNPTDLWEIPLFIHSLVPEYKIYLRLYSTSIGEAVCYAI